MAGTSRNIGFRIASLIIFVVCPGVSVHAQGYLPLKVGNLWQFRDRFDPDLVKTLTIVSDTVWRNGHQYFQFSGPLTESNLIRQEGAVVYSYWAGDSSEYAIFDFGASVGDTISLHPGSQTPILLDRLDSISWFGAVRPRWTTVELASVIFFDRTIIDSIGFYHLWLEGWGDLDFQGAVIDSVTYGTVTDIRSDERFPLRVKVLPTYPNPFNPTTTIRFELPTTTPVTLRIVNALGQSVTSILEGTVLPPGQYRFDWNPGGVAAGVYYFRLTTDEDVWTGKMVYLR